MCNLAMLELDTMDERRESIALKFAGKLLKHPEHRKMFNFDLSSTTRAGRRVIVPVARTTRYERSTVPALANLMNQKLSHKI